MWTIVLTFIINHPLSCIIHIVHIDSDELEPPTLATMIHIVSKIVNDFTNIETKCKRILIQPKKVDDKVRIAQNLFLKLMNGRIPIQIIADPETVERKIIKWTTV